MTVFVEQQRGVQLKASADRSSSYDSTYHIKGTTSLATAGATLLADASCPLKFYEPLNGIYLYRKDVTIKELPRSDIWEASVTWVDNESYDSSAKLDVGSKRISFSTSGGTAHITASLETVSKYAAADAPDTKQAIGLTREGDVQGCDVITPAFKFSVEYRLTKGTITNAYAKTIRDLTGTVSDATFYGFDAGEVLFLGCPNAVQEFQGDPQVSFDFLQLPNLATVTIGDITGISKKGHEYLWVWYTDEKVTAGDGLKWVLKKPKYAFVERVYEEGDLSALGIGTS